MLVLNQIIMWFSMQFAFLISTSIVTIAAEELAIAVVSGEDTNIEERPFQVSLQTNSQHFCGGSIINRNYVVTAAHCTTKKKASMIEVIFGTTDLRKANKMTKVAKIINHEKYEPLKQLKNDIALIKVTTPFKFSDTVEPVRLPKLHEMVNPGTAAVISGWGRLLNEFSKKPDILQQATIFVIDQKKCNATLRGTIYPTNLCANDPNHRRGSCTGDSGGPLTANGKLIGIVSWGSHDPDCASPRYPTVYTRVSEYIDWIKQHQS